MFEGIVVGVVKSADVYERVSGCVGVSNTSLASFISASVCMYVDGLVERCGCIDVCIVASDCSAGKEEVSSEKVQSV